MSPVVWAGKSIPIRLIVLSAGSIMNNPAAHYLIIHCLYDSASGIGER